MFMNYWVLKHLQEMHFVPCQSIMQITDISLTFENNWHFSFICILCIFNVEIIDYLKIFFDTIKKRCALSNTSHFPKFPILFAKCPPEWKMSFWQFSHFLSEHIQFCRKILVSFGTLSKTRDSLTSSLTLGNIIGTTALTVWNFRDKVTNEKPIPVSDKLS